jgi:hypothetical protein
VSGKNLVDTGRDGDIREKPFMDKFGNREVERLPDVSRSIGSRGHFHSGATWFAVGRLAFHSSTSAKFQPTPLTLI